MPAPPLHRRPVTAASTCVSIVSVALLLCASQTDANVYKCAGPSGSIVYQESPCPEGKELRNFDTDPPTLSVIPGVGAPAPAHAKPAPEKTAKRTAPPRDDKSRGKVDGDATARKFIHSGMTEAEVLARIGRPDMTAGGNKNHRTRWSYLPHAGDPDTITTITFNGETVSDVTRKVVKR